MRSEKLNITRNIISRLELPVTNFCAAPLAQPVSGWIIDPEGSGARVVLTLNGEELAYERTHRPDLERGYDTIPADRMYGFRAKALLPADAREAEVALTAVFSGGESAELLRAKFPVKAVDPALADAFRGAGEILNLDAFPPLPEARAFRGVFVLNPGEAGETPATLVLARLRQLLCTTANVHELYRSIYDYAADRLANIAVSQLDLGNLLTSYVEVVDRWLASVHNGRGRWVVTGREAVLGAPFLARVFPEARFEVPGEAPADADVADAWSRLRESLGARASGPGDATPSDANPPADVLSAEWPAFPEERPIFVVGAGRSGTSAATRILSQGEYPSFREGHVFPYLQKQIEVITRVWAPLEELAGAGAAVPRQSLLERELASLVARAAKKDAKATRWADKTPDLRMLEVIPYLVRLYPQAQFIFLRRHPLKLAESRARKFNEPLETALAQWVKCEQLWAGHKPMLPPGSWIECDQGDFSLRTGPTVRKFIDFLRPTESQQFNMLRAARMDRPENTLRLGGDGISSRRDFLYRQLLDMLPVSLQAMNWPAAVVDFYERECRPIAEQLGYPSEPAVDRIKADIRDVSTEIFECEEWLISRACEEVARPPEGVLATGRQFLSAVQARLLGSSDPK